MERASMAGYLWCWVVLLGGANEVSARVGAVSRTMRRIADQAVPNANNARERATISVTELFG
jgi:hypothetical protein